jgi:hypothetical protein
VISKQLKRQARTAYWNEGFTVLPDFVPRSTVEAWSEALSGSLDAGFGRRVIVPERGINYDLVDGINCEKVVPAMIETYRSAVDVLRGITGQAVISSPHERSKVCYIRYPAGGGQQAWHYDTNVVTALLYLTTNQDGFTLAKRLDTGAVVEIQPVAGSLLLMRGRNVHHCGSRVEAAPKGVSPWNYYVDGDTARPEGLDDIIYGPPVQR